MAQSYVVYTGTGAQVTFNVTFPYLSQSHVKVAVNGVDQSITWDSATVVRLAVAPLAGATVKVRRETSPALALVDFSTGFLPEEDLDMAYLHNFYLAQESRDAVDEVIGSISGSGNVPSPTSSDIGKFIRATATGVFGWIALTKAMITDIVFGALASKNTVATADIDNNAVSLVKMSNGTANKYVGFNGAGAASERDAPIFTKTYTSPLQTITAGGPLVIAHGLGVAPRLCDFYLECQTAEMGYAVGDKVIVSPNDADSGTSVASYGFSAWFDATNINIRYGATTNVFIIPDDSTGTRTVIASANWRLVARALA